MEVLISDADNFYYLISFFFKAFIYLFLEKGEGREKTREKETSMCKRNIIDRLPLHAPTQGPDPQPRHVPWLESNRWPFALRSDTQPTEPRRSGHISFLLLRMVYIVPPGQFQWL